MIKQTKFKQTEIGEIPEDWEVTQLGELIDIKHGFAFKGKFFAKSETRDILLTPGNVAIGGGFQDEKSKYYNGDVPQDYVLSPGDIFVNMTDLSKAGDTLGFSAVVPKTKNKRYLHNQRLGLVKLKSQKVNKQFIYWKMRDPYYRGCVLGSATGTTVKHTSPTRIKNIFIGLPSLDEQKQITSILSSLDDKIELNRKMNKTLEEIGKALFKHWFVDFEFPNDKGKPYKSSGGEMVDSELGEIPEGWKIDSLGSFSEIQNGFAFKSKDYQDNGIALVRTRDFGEEGYVRVNEPVYLPDGFYESYSKYRLKKFDILLVMVGASVGKRSFVTSSSLPSLQNQNMWNFRVKNKGQLFLKHLLDRIVEKNIGSASGSAREFFRKDFFRTIMFVLPPTKTLLTFEEIMQSLYGQIDINISENKNLKKIRDSLLPRLMSGRLRVW